MRWLAAVVLVGCGFSPGSLREDGAVTGDGTDGAPSDVPRDSGDPPANCYARWFDGTIQFGAPVAMTTVSSLFYDRDPFLTPDELTLYQSSLRPTSADGDLWIAKRASISDAFDPPALDTDFSSPDFESKLSISGDGLIAVVGSNRTGSVQTDVWMSVRQSVDDPWPAPTQDLLGSVNTAAADLDPTISADGLRLYLAPNTGGTQRVVVATRASRTDSFGVPAVIAALDSSMGDADPSPTPDERIIVFSSSRTGQSVPLEGNVWYATRSSNAGTFGTPQLVPGINTDVPEGDPHLSADGCRLYLGRDVGDNSDWDLFVATAQP